MDKSMFVGGVMRLKTVLAAPALLFICADLPVRGQQVREQQGVYATPLV